MVTSVVLLLLSCWSPLDGLYQCMPRKEKGRFQGDVGAGYLLGGPWKDEV